jgi:hypothetical protein
LTTSLFHSDTPPKNCVLAERWQHPYHSRVVYVLLQGSDTEALRLLLSFGGASINRSLHLLQRNIESSKISATSDGDSDGNDDDDEWFENHRTVANVRGACAALRQQRSLALPAVTFGLAGVDKAHRPGREKRTKTSVGDIVLDYKGKLLIVTGMLPKPPTPPTLKIKGQTITVAWSQ